MLAPIPSTLETAGDEVEFFHRAKSDTFEAYGIPSPHNALIMIADGGKAILFRTQGTSGELSLREEKRLSPENLLDEGPSGSRPEEQTLQQTDEAIFAKQLAKPFTK